MNVGSLFAGIGGFDLGLERAGMRTVWQVEQSEFCRAVLQRHFPHAERYEDVRYVGTHNLQPVDVVCGGFPCQPVSVAGRKRGQDDERWLWPEFARIIRELRPRYVVVENVPGLLNRGMADVLGDLAACGYDAEWDCLPAAAFGAPHLRDRVWLLAYPDGDRRDPPGESEAGDEGEALASARAPSELGGAGGRRSDSGPRGRGGAPVADSNRASENALPPSGRSRTPASERGGEGRAMEDAAGAGRREPWSFFPDDANGAGALRVAGGSGGWEVEPDVGRVADGFSARVDGPRLTALGNALVPQVAEWIGRRILEWERVAA